LKLQEIWVITKGDRYVSECINESKKKLVEYCSTREHAKAFRSHEKAKSTMKVLKSVVGPGFGLQRYFVMSKED